MQLVPTLVQVSYLSELYGDVRAELDTSLGSGVNIYRLKLSS